MRYWARITVLTALLASMQQAAASTLQVWTQSAASVGDVGAGATARVDNDSSYYNPAAMPWIQRQDMGFSLLSSVNNVKFKGNVATTPAISGFNGGRGAQGGEVNYIPNLFYVAPLSREWSVGLSITSPYNNSIDYGRNSAARYSVSQWYLRTIDISPSIGFRFIRSLSVGIGFDAQRSAIRFYQVSNNGTTDLTSETNLQDWGYGWNSGIIWQPCDFARLGASYHSGISHRSAGSSDIPGGHSRANAIYRLPSMVSMGTDFGLGKKLHLLGTANYTHWSELGDVQINNLQNASGNTNTVLFSHLKNSWLFSVGAHYLVISDLTLKTGFGFDQGAISDSYRNLVLPDGDHYIASIGANYKLNNNFNLDFGYSHYFNHNVSIHSSQPNGTTTVTTNGDVDTGSDIFAIQLNWLMT